MTNDNTLEKDAETKLKIEKEAKSKLPLPKFYYDVKIEAMLPATLTYRILAENPQQAVDMIRGKTPNSVQHKLYGRKELILRVYDAGSSLIRLVLNTWRK